MNLRFSTKAFLDVDSIAERIQQDSPRSALRFIEAAEATAENLLLFPEFGAAWESDDPELQGLRLCLVRDFPKYLLFYRLKGDEIIIVRIIHSHRNLPDALKE